MTEKGSNYIDRWVDDVLHYTGMGQNGDQSLKYQNRTLAESNSNGVQVFLFEVYCRGKYIFLGEVKLESEPYQEKQADNIGSIRDVWIFPVKLVSDKPIFDKATIDELFQSKLKESRQINNDELKKRAERGEQQPSKRVVFSTQYDRSPWVVEYVKRRANGFCEACGASAPFKTEDNIPYLEVHHIKPLAEGGGDTINNAAALCPNCHRRCHYAKDKVSYGKELQNKLKTGDSVLAGHERGGLLETESHA